MQEVVEAEHFDLLFPLHGVWWTLFRHARSGPENLTLTEPDGIDVLLPDLQDQTAVHHVQQGIGVEPLLLVLDLRRPREQNLLQGDGSEQVNLLRGWLQVSVVQPAALRVTDGQRAHRPAPVLELQVQICYYSKTEGTVMISVTTATLRRQLFYLLLWRQDQEHVNNKSNSNSVTI